MAENNQTYNPWYRSRAVTPDTVLEMFSEAAPLYEKAFSEAGYNVKLKYNPNKKIKQKKQKKKHNMV